MTPAPLLITGAHGPAGRSLLAQLAERGIPAIGADMAAGTASAQDAPAGPFPVLPVPPARDPAYPQALRELAAAHGASIIIPTVSEELPLIARLADKLGEGVRVIISPPEAASIADDKLRTARALTEAGVPVPAFAGGEEIATAEEAARRIGLPLIVKPRISRGARGVRLVREPDELGELGASLILQSFAPGTEYAPVVYVPLPGGRLRRAGHEEPFAAVLEKTGLTAGEVGNATGVRRIGGTAAQDVASAAVSAALAAGLTGPVDVDVRRDSEGIPVVLELNARFGANSRAVPELLGLLLDDLGIAPAAAAAPGDASATEAVP